MRKGLTEGDAQSAIGELDEQCSLAPATIAALRLADVLSASGTELDDGLATELRRHYDDGQILELAAALSVGSGWQRLIETFGIRPDSWTDTT